MEQIVSEKKVVRMKRNQEIIEMYTEGISLKSDKNALYEHIARAFGVSKSSVIRIIQNATSKVKSN